MADAVNCIIQYSRGYELVGVSKSLSSRADCGLIERLFLAFLRRSLRRTTLIGENIPTKMRWLRPLRSAAHLTALSRTDQSVSVIQSHPFGTHTGNGGESGSGRRSNVSRDWLAQMWKQEIRQWKEERRWRGRVRKGDGDGGEGLFGGSSGFQHSFLNWGTDGNNNNKGVPGTAAAATAVTVEDRGNAGAVFAERKLASLLSRTDLVVARDIEWANVLFAFEQESRYFIMDASAPHSPVGYIRETSNVIFRQLLRTRRPFVAHVIDSYGNEIFRVRRPFWLINSTIYAEVDGKEIGVVHRRWHLWRRIYDLYLGNKQFAVVENPGFWNWTFTLKDEEDNMLAQIDRNWRGIGLELFTDAGQYVIRFGGSGSSSVYHDLNDHIEKLEVVRPLTLPERAIALALAVSLDCDYFSRRGGWGIPIMIFEE